MDGKNASKQFLQITTETKEIGVFGKMEQRYYQKEIETMPLEDMKALQSERLVAQVKHVYENVPGKNGCRSCKAGRYSRR